MNSYLLLFAVLPGLTGSATVAFNEVHRQTEGIIYPSGFYVFEDHKAIFHEPLSGSETVTKVDLQTGELLASLRSGQGPGEVTPDREKVITQTESGEYWLWDSGHQRGMLLDSTFSYQSDLGANQSNLAFALPLSDDRVGSWSIFSRSNLFSIREFDNFTVVDEEPFETIPYEDYDEFEQVAQNPLSRQGPTLAKDGAIYQGYLYSSTMVKLTADGLEYLTGQEQNIPFPEYDSGRDGVFEAPDHGLFPQATLSIAANENYLFVLHSGRKFDEGRLRTAYYRITGRWEELNEKYDHTDRLLIYDRATGDYLHEMELPEPANKIQATDSYLYSYSYMEQDPVIITYEMMME